jgi:propionyl-CoA carboxylase alpha chain
MSFADSFTDHGRPRSLRLPVAVMEAMKMENILRAGRAATVKATPAKVGDSLAVEQVIVEFE